MLDALVDDVDGVDHVALVLLILTDDGTELPLGLARIIRYPRRRPAAADLAVTSRRRMAGPRSGPPRSSRSSCGNGPRA